MKNIAVFVARCNMKFYDGDEIKEGTKSIAVKKGRAFFKTKKGIEVSFSIIEMNEHYFKPWTIV